MGSPGQILTDIQREGVHRPVRHRPGAGAVRPNLRATRSLAGLGSLMPGRHDRDRALSLSALAG